MPSLGLAAAGCGEPLCYQLWGSRHVSPTLKMPPRAGWLRASFQVSFSLDQRLGLVQTWARGSLPLRPQWGTLGGPHEGSSQSTGPAPRLPPPPGVPRVSVVGGKGLGRGSQGEGLQTGAWVSKGGFRKEKAAKMTVVPVQLTLN